MKTKPQHTLTPKGLIIKQTDGTDSFYSWAYIDISVNAHEDLLKIAKAYRNMLRTSTDTESFIFAEEAIAKAEGK